MRKGYVDTPEGQVHYRTEGNGDCLLMLHQTPTSSDDFSIFMPLLSHRFRVIAMDTLGYGMSDIPNRKLSIEEYAQNAGHFLDALGISQTHVFGHHTGALLAVELATSQPNEVMSLTLFGCPCWDLQKRMRYLDDPAFTQTIIDADGDFIMRKWQRSKGAWPPGTSPERWYPGFTASVLAGPRTHDGHIAAFKYDVLSRFPKVHQPVLLLSVELDRWHADLERTAGLFHDCRVKVLQGGGSLVYDPATLANAIIEFI